jgi:hypothetical protein
LQYTCHQVSTVVISGHQWSSVVISGHQWSLVVIRSSHLLDHLLQTNCSHGTAYA